ncbi:hypothetical protein Vadar_019326 [Vaccinium darrowii]|uniref:Uncharacterized protein n=1 Tax=Vaccinium darrowii TaxID=229202 RepID=A0ACB7YFQ0_9ERIC|nr:hypothetical protein Vadar_019326 [Vaccinium darrowii]
MILFGSFQCFRCDDEICLIVLRIWLGGVAWSSSTELSAVSCSGFHNFSGNEAVDGSIVNLVFWEVLGDLRFLRFVLRFFITVLDFKDSITNFQCSGLKASREYYGYFKMKPKLHYGEEDCHLSVSDSFPLDAELHFEIQMIDFSIPIDSNEI